LINVTGSCYFYKALRNLSHFSLQPLEKGLGMSSKYWEPVVRAIRNAGGPEVPSSVEPGASLVLNLGFDSMKMAMLSLSLEGEFGCAIMLDDWIASHPDPHDLTVESLCEYLWTAIGETRRPVAP
jgi:acyl carrier protein